MKQGNIFICCINSFPNLFYFLPLYKTQVYNLFSLIILLFLRLILAPLQKIIFPCIEGGLDPRMFVRLSSPLIPLEEIILSVVDHRQ